MRRIAGNGFADSVAIANNEDQEHGDARKKPQFSVQVEDTPDKNTPGSFGTGTTMEPRTITNRLTNSNKDQQTPSSSWNAGSSHSGSNNTASSREIGQDIVRLRYSAQVRSDPVSPATLNLVVGVRVCFPPKVDIKSEKKASLENSMQFSIDPKLPEGLDLNASTGLISGVPQRAQAAPSVHHITISIDATGPGGIPLGSVPLITCTIVVRVLDLNSYALAGLEERADREGCDELVLKLRRC
jgi:hypothetical protein